MDFLGKYKGKKSESFSLIRKSTEQFFNFLLIGRA